MAEGSTVGRTHKAYLNSATHASPTWVELKRIRDATINPDKTKVEIASRESAWNKKKGGMKVLSAEMTYLRKKKAADSNFNTLLDSFLNGTAVELAFMDEAIATSGAEGWRGYYEVFTLT